MQRNRFDWQDRAEDSKADGSWWTEVSGSPRLFTALVIALMLLAATRCFGQEHCAPDYAGTRRAEMEVAGAPGIWFALPVARCILGDLEELTLLRERVGLLEERLTLRDDQHLALLEAVDLADQAEQRAVSAMQLSEQRALDAEGDAGAWWKSPALWFAAGFAAASTVVALAAYALSAI